MDLNLSIKRDFDLLVDQNPLKRLEFGYQQAIWTSLRVALKPKESKTEAELLSSTGPIEALHEAEQIAKALLAATKTLRKNHFGLDAKRQDLFEALLDEYSRKLTAFSEGKPSAGHFDDYVSNRLIVSVSLLIHAVTGSFHDGPLSELGQLLPNSDGLSAEALGKRRNRFRVQHERDYQALKAKAERLSLKLQFEHPLQDG